MMSRKRKFSRNFSGLWEFAMRFLADMRSAGMQKMEKGYRRSPINKALFETWSICIKEASDEAVELLFLYKEDFIEKYCDFLADEKYSTSLKGGDESSLKRRIDLTKNFLREFVYAYKS